MLELETPPPTRCFKLIIFNSENSKKVSFLRQINLITVIVLMLKISILLIPQVPLGVLNKDESTTAGMVEILVDYTKYVPRTRDEVPFPLVLFVMASAVIEWKGHRDKKN